LGAAAVVGRELLDVGGAADRVPDRVEEDREGGEAGGGVEARRELDDLRVDRRPRVADGLDTELPERSISTGLRPVVAEHLGGRRDLHRLRPGLEAMLDVGADDARGRLGPERPPLAVLLARREQEELLLDDVGDLADAALEDRDLLEQRGRDRVVAVALGKLGAEALEAQERDAILREQVARAPRGAKSGHRAEVYVGRSGNRGMRGQAAIPGRAGRR
jgi:hypothetical protein